MRPAPKSGPRASLALRENLSMRENLALRENLPLRENLIGPKDFQRPCGIILIVIL